MAEEVNNVQEFNECAQLIKRDTWNEAMELYNTLLSEGKDPMQTIIDMQRSLQIALADRHPDRCWNPDKIETVGDKADWLRFQKEAFDDEFREMIDSLPGMSRPAKDRSAAWKRWKAKYNEIRGLSDKDMTTNDLIESQFEFIDALHFFINMSFPFKLSAAEMFAMYYIKNAENFARQERGY